MIRVLIADDHRLVAEALERVINQSDVAQVVGVSTTLQEVSVRLRDMQPDILLLDIAMPDGDGIDAVPELKAQYPNVRIIILTMYAEAAVIGRALSNNVDGYLLKSIDTKELIAALEAVADDDIYVCEECKQIMSQARYVEHVKLAPREREVLQLIVDGLTEKEIADKLFLSFETVHSYTKYLRRKLNCHNTAALVRVAIEQHIV